MAGKMTSTELVKSLTSIGGKKADDKLAKKAVSNDRDVTNISSEDLGDYVKLTVKSKMCCFFYGAGDRIMVSIQ